MNMDELLDELYNVLTLTNQCKCKDAFDATLHIINELEAMMEEEAA